MNKMKILDDAKAVKELDRSSVLASSGLLPDQINQAWNEVSKIKIPLHCYQEVKNIVVAGMGGSALGARIVDSLNFEVLDVPLEIVNGYHLPAYVNQETLVVVSSYSGNTEETLACGQEAIRKKCQIFVITTGGRLARMAQKHQLPAYIFSPRYNPSGQPRLGLGYSITAQLALLSRCGFIRLGEAQATQAIHHLEKLREQLGLKVPSEKNMAKKAAASLKNKIVVLTASEHLEGSAHAFKNMLNENSKNFAAMFNLPEMNHHLLEGLRFPEANKKTLQFLFLESDIYEDDIQKRLSVTKKVVEKNKISCLELKMKGKTRLDQAFETIYLGGFISGYLAILYGIDPAPIPWVDFFKKTLREM